MDKEDLKHKEFEESTKKMLERDYGKKVKVERVDDGTLFRAKGWKEGIFIPDSADKVWCDECEKYIKMPCKHMKIDRRAKRCCEAKKEQFGRFTQVRITIRSPFEDKATILLRAEDAHKLAKKINKVLEGTDWDYENKFYSKT